MTAYISASSFVYQSAALVCGLGFGIAFSEGGSGLRRALWVVLGLAIAFSATNFFVSFMGFSGGLAI